MTHAVNCHMLSKGVQRGNQKNRCNPAVISDCGLVCKHNALMSHISGMFFTRMRQNADKICGALSGDMSLSCNRIIINKIRGV